MTIDVPNLRELPPEEMAGLDAAAESSVRRAAERLPAYAHDWPDLRVVVDVMPDAERLLRELFGKPA